MQPIDSTGRLIRPEIEFAAIRPQFGRNSMEAGLQ